MRNNQILEPTFYVPNLKNREKRGKKLSYPFRENRPQTFKEFG